jgi:hypothetical protein
MEGIVGVLCGVEGLDPTKKLLEAVTRDISYDGVEEEVVLWLRSTPMTLIARFPMYSYVN